LDCAGKAPAATALSHARASHEFLRTVARTTAGWPFAGSQNSAPHPPNIHVHDFALAPRGLLVTIKQRFIRHIERVFLLTQQPATYCIDL
jgi:hypothetical protein